MKNKSNQLKSAAIVTSAIVAGSMSASANTNLFEYNELGSGAQLRNELIELNQSNVSAMDAVSTVKFAELKCGENTCGGEGKKAGEHKCGEGKCGEGKKAGEHKCGEGKCGEGKKAGEHKCGEGKCGEGKKAGEHKCGEGKCGEGKKAGEHKCGEGKCGEGKK